MISDHTIIIYRNILYQTSDANDVEEDVVEGDLAGIRSNTSDAEEYVVQGDGPHKEMCLPELHRDKGRGE